MLRHLLHNLFDLLGCYTSEVLVEKVDGSEALMGMGLVQIYDAVSSQPNKFQTYPNPTDSSIGVLQRRLSVTGIS